MKKINIIIAVLFVLSGFVSGFVPGFVPGAMAQARIVVENPVFTFESIPEGSHVSHEFIIKNSGDTLMHITNVKPP